MRGFSALESLITGTLVGALTGLIAWGLAKAIRPKARIPTT